MKKLIMLVAMLGLFATPSLAVKPEDVGFDEFGYNLQANNFVGTGNSWCMGKLHQDWAYCDAYMGGYGNDKLVMKWNESWDKCNETGLPEDCVGAWINNEWNGNVADGSGEVWHYKIIWVGPELTNSEYWVDGGYAIWGQYEIIMDQGTASGEHSWYTHGVNTGYGN